MEILYSTIHDAQLQKVAQKAARGERIDTAEATILYQRAHLGLLAQLANIVCQRHNSNNVYFNRNFHIEPTNICVYSCKFCSYRRPCGDQQCWEMNLEDIKSVAQNYVGKNVSEVHIVGGVHPKWGLDYYCDIVGTVRAVLPKIHIKAFSVIELHYVFTQAGVSSIEGYRQLKEAGLNSIPGGGAEIFSPEIRTAICPEKPNASTWLDMHAAAHEMGIASNATMLYGHIEGYEHRAEHMAMVRNLQDRTHGFNCFIPLKYRCANNALSHLGEVPLVEDLRNYAVCRIFMDNIPHLKAYWPMFGVENTKLAIAFGADDIDGTIDDTTKIYSMAGAEEQKPSMSVERITQLIREAGRNPVERNSMYQPIEL